MIKQLISSTLLVMGCVVWVTLTEAASDDSTKERNRLRRNLNDNGVSITPFIINGDKMDPWEHPYLVSLGFYKKGLHDHQCGASKISDRAVLTAARKL